MHSNVKMSQTRKNKQKNIQDIKEQMKILGSKKTQKKQQQYFSTHCMLSSMNPRLQPCV